MLRQVSLTSKMLLLTLLIGAVAWAVLDHIQTRSISKLFHDQLNEELSQQAQADRLVFDDFVKTHAQSVKLLASQKRFNDYLDKVKASGWASDGAGPFIYTRRPPPWFPRFSVARAFMQARYALLLGPDGVVREAYQTGSKPPPGELLRPSALLRELSHSQSYMTNVGGAPFLIASESITDDEGRTVATLLLASPLDDETLFATHGMSQQNRITALLSGERPRVIASSRPDLIPAGSTIEDLSGKFLMAGKSFFDYGSSDLRLQFSSFITKDKMEELTGAVLRKERNQRAITALVLVVVFTLILVWITGNIRLLSTRVSDFSISVLGLKPKVGVKGDELMVLKDEFESLTEEVITAREALEREAEEKLALERRAAETRLRKRDINILMQVMEILGVGVIDMRDGEPAALNPVMEKFALDCGGIFSFVLEEGRENKELGIGDCEGESRTFRISRFYSPEGLEYRLVHDLTESRRSEQALRESEAKFRSLVEDSLAGVYIIQDGRFVYVNPRLSEIFGYTQEEIVSQKKVFDLVAPENRKEVMDNIRKRLDGEIESIHYQFQGVRNGGALIDVEVFGSQTVFNGRPAIVGTLLDITERKTAEETLRESESRARAITETATDAIILIDNQGRITYWNPAAEKIFGYTAGEVMGEDVHELLTPKKYLPAAKRGFEAFTQTGTGPALGIARVLSALRKDGTEFPIELSLSAFQQKGKWVAVGVIRDITDRVKAEEDKSTMFHMMTHDIKGPLSIIYGYCELLNTQFEGSENIEMVSEIQKAAGRISELIDDMLTLSRIESGKAPLNFEEVSLTELVDQAVLDAELKAAEMGVTFEVSVDEETPRILADRVQLGRALGNLTVNAVNYNRQGGKVFVKAGREDGGGPEAETVFIEVSDTGIGIPEEDIPRVFEKYFRSKATGSRRGTGLGLAIVKAAVEAHGGNVSVSCGQGAGCSFKVELPARPQAALLQKEAAQES